MDGHPSKLRVQIVIPARLHSTRLPKKLLLRETGKTLIQHTYEAACRARRSKGVIVATDAEEIAQEVRSFGGEVRMTSPTLASGTDRVAAVASELTDADVLVNVQGDEPEIAGEAIDLAIEQLERDWDRGAVMSTVATPIRRREKLEDPACVKVVFDDQGRALYFSRSMIPHPREWDDELLQLTPAVFHQHLGLYAYRREFLLELAKTPRATLEMVENLEQLRVLAAGMPILLGVTPHSSMGIDTPADYAAYVQRMRRGDSRALRAA
jgi:3-deoxy-manno-octulosonate cytidylyltransferase (CMP-KDO synthetase)